MQGEAICFRETKGGTNISPRKSSGAGWLRKNRYSSPNWGMKTFPNRGMQSREVRYMLKKAESVTGMCKPISNAGR